MLIWTVIEVRNLDGREALWNRFKFYNIATHFLFFHCDDFDFDFILLSYTMANTYFFALFDKNLTLKN